MDFQSVIDYVGKNVKITLLNQFWYRAKIISCEEDSVVFVEERGKRISVTPAAIMMIVPMEDENGK